MPRQHTPKIKQVAIRVSDKFTVSALLLKPADADALFVFAHGAGAGMDHPFMESMAQRLSANRIATLRYQFPYMEGKRRAPNPKPVLLATVKAAVEFARAVDDSLVLVAGGKSMGGRMTSLAASQQLLSDISGIVFLGFPLHPPGSPSVDRSAHLADVPVPMLFLQGTRDKLADLTLLRPVIKQLGRMATLHVVEGADHSFHLSASKAKSEPPAFDHLAQVMREWISRLPHKP